MRICFTGLLFCLILTAPACYEPIEGCLDPAAANFQLDADRDCADCCDYPELSIVFQHRWVTSDTTLTLRYEDQVYTDGIGQAFHLERITYYLHEFALLTTSGQLQFTADSLDTRQQLDNGEVVSQIIRDDFLLVNPVGLQSISVGRLVDHNTYTALRFKVGLDANSRRILPASLPTDHPLSLLDSTMYDLTEQHYYSLRVDLLRDTTENAPSASARYSADQTAIPIEVPIPGGFTLPAGSDLKITLQVDYFPWFGNISNIATGSEMDIVTQIVAGIPVSFKLIDIQAQ